MSGPDLRAIAPAELPEGSFPTVDAGFRVHIDEAAFDRATARGEQDLTREVGGVLVGRLLKDEGGPFLLVETTIDALHAEERDTELTFTHETWAHIHETMDAEHEDRQILGWYHTHPGFGVFLSDRDKFIHRSFFNLPHQVALVYDPKSREHGIFLWRGGEPVRGRRYWIGGHRHVWEPAGAPEEKPRKQAEPAGESRSGQEEPLQDWLSTGVVAVACLLLGGLLGWWLAPRSGGSREERAVEILAAQQKGYQAAVAELNPQLVELVRRDMAAEGLMIRELALKGLADGVSALASEEASEEADEEARRNAVERITRSQISLVRLHEEESRARGLLDKIGALHAGISDVRKNEKNLFALASVLGQICSDLAEDARKAGDIPRARRLLTWAKGITPGRTEALQKRIDDLEKPEEHR